MKHREIAVIAVVAIAFFVVLFLAFQRPPAFQQPSDSVEFVDDADDAVIQLPEPKKRGNVSVEEAIMGRRSVRSYTDEPLNLHHISQLLWAAQGITDPIFKRRSAPSAGATYPLEIYVVIGNCSVVLCDECDRYLKEGVYHYDPLTHRIERVAEGDLRAYLCDAAIGQEWVRDAPVDFVICAVYERTTNRYGERGMRYVQMEAGHAAQNMYLQCESLGCGMVVVGAFFDDEVQKLLNTTAEPLYVIPVGHPQ